MSTTVLAPGRSTPWGLKEGLAERGKPEGPQDQKGMELLE